jgi:Ca2+-binding RTX toxin-like protein
LFDASDTHHPNCHDHQFDVAVAIAQHTSYAGRVRLIFMYTPQLHYLQQRIITMKKLLNHTLMLIITIVSFSLLSSSTSGNLLGSDTLYASPNFASSDNVQCAQPKYYGVLKCTYSDTSGKTIQFLRIDGHNPHVEFQVAAGNYSLSNGVFTCQDTNNCRYTIQEMIDKWPTKNNKPAVAAINTDYFGGSDPAQGTTIINGVFKYEFFSETDNQDWDFGPLDGQGDGICDKRSSLSISNSSPYYFSIGKCQSGYNVTSGGPQFLLNGNLAWDPDPDHLWPTGKVGAINGEYFYETNFESSSRQSAIGIDSTGQFLILASSISAMHPSDMAQALSDTSLYGVLAHNGLRFDGGGSVQMYYDGEYLVSSSDDPDRKVPAGLIVYSDPLPNPLPWAEIRSVHSDKCADVKDISVSNGALLQQWECWQGLNQLWQFEKIRESFWGKPIYQIRSVNSGKCLEAKDWSTDNGTPIQQWECHGGDNQLWRLEKTNGNYQLVNENTIGFLGLGKKCLDVQDWGTSDGVPLQLWDCHDGENQQWIIQGSALVGSGSSSTVSYALTIYPQETHTVSVMMAVGEPSGIFYTTWLGSDVITTLQTPSGRVIDRSTISPDVSHSLGSTYEIYIVTEPEAGEWQVSLYGADVPPDGEYVLFEFITAADNPPPPPVLACVEGSTLVLNMGSSEPCGSRNIGEGEIHEEFVVEEIGDGEYTVTAFGLTQTYDGVNDIQADGEEGNDSIELINVTVPANLSGGEGDDTLQSGAGDDTLSGGDGNDTINGNDGVDAISGEAGDDLLSGGAGDDIISGGDGADSLTGDDGVDTLNGDGGTDDIHGGADDDMISGGADNDTLHGDSGEDNIHGNTGDDTIYGDEDNDTLYGDDDADSLYGGSGDDLIYGNSGNDTIYGDAGQDNLIGGSETAGVADGDDTIYGGDGSGTTSNDYDVIVGDNAQVSYMEQVNSFNLALTRDIWLYDIASATSSVSATSFGNDNLYGESGDDLVYGQGGNDLVSGGTGEDYLEGNDGGDTLLGGLGNDDMVGGTGRINDDPATGTNGRLDQGDTMVGGGQGDVMLGDNGTIERPLDNFGLWQYDPNTNDAIRDIHLVDVKTVNNAADPAASGSDLMYGDEGRDYMFGQGNDGIDDDGDGHFDEDPIDSVDNDRDGRESNQSVSFDCLDGKDNDNDGLTDTADPDCATAIDEDDGGDEMHGGMGDDYMEGNHGSDEMYGDEDEDDMIGGSTAGDGHIFGGVLPTNLTDGDDTMHGGTDDDQMIGDNGSIIRPTDGNGHWLFLDGYGYHIVIRVVGMDEMPEDEGAFGHDYMRGNDGHDEMYGQLGADYLEGNNDEDAMLGDLGLITTNIEDGSREEVIAIPAPFLEDTIYPEGSLYRLVDLYAYENGDDAEWNDIMLGGNGNDSIHGGAGNDLANGNADEDHIFGDDGDDALWGGPGDDHLYGGYGDDYLDVKPRTTRRNRPGNNGNNRSDPPEWHTYAGLDNYQGFDLLYGGWDQDAMQANVGGPGLQPGDRLVDWVGSYNVYYTCPAAYGESVITRMKSPQLIAYLQLLAEADGALATMMNGTSGFRELAMVFPNESGQNSHPPHPDHPGHFVCN